MSCLICLNVFSAWPGKASKRSCGVLNNLVPQPTLRVRDQSTSSECENASQLLGIALNEDSRESLNAHLGSSDECSGTWTRLCRVEWLNHWRILRYIYY